MKFSKNNSLLHQQRMLALEQRQMEEHIHRLRQDEPSRYNAAGEPLVVATAQLIVILKEWRDRYDLEYDTKYRTNPNETRNDVTVFGPIQYLESESGVNARQIQRILREEVKYTSATTAEKLLMAIDKEYLMTTEALPIIPNPRWTYERWINWFQQQGCE